MNREDKIKHLYARAGFGIKANKLASIKNKNISTVVDDLFLASESYSVLRFPKQTREHLSKKQRNKLFRQNILKLNQLWVKRMSSNKEVLREKMTLFWHDHFACRILQSNFSQSLNNTLRKEAIGNFAKLVYQVSKEPAMIQFLNNKQNKKESPNENFARELLELFTIGRGNYTEKDIQEAARAFTGWSFNSEGEFEIKERQHDSGEKTFFGQTGNFGGKDIIRIILEDKRTATYIAGKLYAYFVSDTKDEKRIDSIASKLYINKYEIEPTLKYIFNSKWFYDKDVVGTKIKSPIELLVGLNHQFEIDYKQENITIFLQRILGQFLFFPPNVAGWPGGRSWIDSSTLNYRLKIPSALLNSGVIEWQDAGNDEMMMEMKSKANEQRAQNFRRKINTTPDWKQFKQSIAHLKSTQDLVGFLLQANPSSAAKRILKDASKDLEDKVVEIVSLPEYQLC